MFNSKIFLFLLKKKGGDMERDQVLEEILVKIGKGTIAVIEETLKKEVIQNEKN